MPVPPLVTGTVPRLMAGVVVPVVTLRGDVAVTLVTVPEVLAMELSWPWSSITTVWGEAPPRVAPRMPAMKALLWPEAGVAEPL